MLTLHTVQTTLNSSSPCPRKIYPLLLPLVEKVTKHFSRRYSTFYPDIESILTIFHFELEIVFTGFLQQQMTMVCSHFIQIALNSLSPCPYWQEDLPDATSGPACQGEGDKAFYLRWLYLTGVLMIGIFGTSHSQLI